jgi:hypothetical protein
MAVQTHDRSSDDGNVQTVSTIVDTEKSAAPDAQVTSAPRSEDDDLRFDSDDNSSFQEGVQRARAITSIWSKSTLISMFAM